MPKRVLIIDDVHFALTEGLNSHGFEVFYEKDIAVSDVCHRADSLKVEGIVVRSKMHFSGEILQELPSLKWIARAGVGTDNIDMEIAQQKGIAIINADGANALTVAEHVLGMILGFLHKLPAADAHVRSGLWNRELHRGRELTSHKIGIIGFGHTGSALAGLLRGFDLQIVAYDKYKSGFGNSQVIEVDSIQKVWEQADILSFHVPLNAETKGMIHGKYLVNQNRKPIIVNASRGGVLDVDSMVNALKTNAISGLILDVWPDEPPLKKGGIYEAAFRDIQNSTCVMFSPHVAGWSEESYERISHKLLDNVLKFKGCA